MRVVCLTLLVMGCDRVYGLDGRTPIDGTVADDTIVVDSEALPVCYGTGLVQLCTQPVDSNLTLEGRIDTTTDPRCQAFVPVRGVTDACVLAGQRIRVAGPLRVVGVRPLLLVGGDINLEAPIDASSDRAGDAGAGARATCPGPTGTNGAGGPGGTYQFAGGNGGNTSTAPAIAANSPMPLGMLGGGCAGGRGGVTTGGAGGGAVYSIATNALLISSASGIDVSGAGGDGSAGGAGTNDGGGGGGSGGLVGLDAPAITIQGPVIARGGGGGGGATASNPGGSGGEASLAMPMGQIAGGAGAVTAGSGGDGSNGTAGGIPASATTGTGGGGGGGSGYILVYGDVHLEGVLNPAPTM